MPPFHTSQPIEDVPSLEESLLLCNEYHIPENTKRPIDLYPFVDCIGQAARVHAKPGTEGFRIFRSELERIADGLRPEEWNPERAKRLDLALHAALKAIWRGKRFEGRFTKAEQRAVLTELPRTSLVIGVSKWTVITGPSAPPPAMSRGLERLRAGVYAVGLLEKEGLAFQPARQSQFENLRQETEYLGALWEDLLSMRKIDARHPDTLEAERRYQERLKMALEKLKRLRETTGRTYA